MVESFSPTLVYVSAFPPVACYPHATSLKSTGFLRGLSQQKEIFLLACSANWDFKKTVTEMRRHWGDYENIRFAVVNSKTTLLRFLAPFRRSFFSETRIDFEEIIKQLDLQNRNLPIVFDDICLSSLMPRYGVRAILSAHDCLSRLFLIEFRFATRFSNKVPFLYRHWVARHHEKIYYHKAAAIHFVNSEDESIFKTLSPASRTFICPIAGLLKPITSVACPRDIDLLFWGNLDSSPIIFGLKKLLSMMRSIPFFHKLSIVILGRSSSPDPELFQFEIPFTYISKCNDLESMLQRTKFCILPDSDGVGIKNRAIDCLSQGACLVGLRSQLGGIPTPLDYCLAADNLEELPRSIECCYQNNRYVSLAMRGLAVFMQHLTPDAVSRTFLSQARRIAGNSVIL